MTQQKMSRADAPKKQKKDSAAKTLKSKPAPLEKKSVQRSFRLTEDANEILKAIKDSKEQHGLTQDAFIVKAIRDCAEKMLGKDAIPASPEKILETRFDYLERVASKTAWEALCKNDSKKAQRMYDIAEELELDPQNMSQKCVTLYKKRYKGGKSNKALWQTAAFAVKFKFKVEDGADDDE